MRTAAVCSTVMLFVNLLASVSIALTIRSTALSLRQAKKEVHRFYGRARENLSVRENLPERTSEPSLRTPMCTSC